MLTFLVMVGRQTNRSAPRSRLSDSSRVTKSPVVHPLSIQKVTKCYSRNSFILKTIHFDGGCVPHGCSDVQTLPTFRRVPELSPFLSHSCALFCTFLHLQKSQLICFQAILHSLRKNTGGGWRGDADLKGATTRKLGAAMCAIGGRLPAGDLSGWISSGQYIDF